MLCRTPAVFTGVASFWGLACSAAETTKVGIWPPPPSPAVPTPEVSESAPSSNSMTTWPPAAYHDEAWTLPRKFPIQASPTVGTVSPSAMSGPSCMSSTALGVTHTKAGGLAELRSALKLVDRGTTLAAKFDSDVTAGK